MTFFTQRAGAAWSAALVAALSFSSFANAAILVDEPFTYADGSLVGNDPAVGAAWAAHSGAGNVPIQVSSNAAVLVQGSGSREDANVGFEGGVTADASTMLFATFDLTVADPGATPSSVYFASFLQGTSNYSSRVFVTAPETSGYRVALTNGSSSLDGTSAYSADLAFGTTYSVGLSYDYNAQSAGNLYVDGVLVGTATDSGFQNAIAAFAFRQANANTSQTIDNLRVATTAEELGLPSSAVPEPASLAALAGVAAVGLRRRRRQG